MTWNVSEVRRNCAAQGITLPKLKQVGTTVTGLPVHGCTVTGGDSFRAWYELREVQPLSGWWPFLSGDLPLAAIEVGQWSSDGDLLKQGQQIDAEEWLQARALASANVLVDLPEARGSFKLMTQALTAQARSVRLADVGGLYVSGLRAEAAGIYIVPASQGYEVPALLNWSVGWSHGLSSAEHCAVLRHFHERYDAELVTLGATGLELLVKSRPHTPQAAAVAALELAAYCPDIARPNGLLELIKRQLRNNTWQLRWVETPQMSDSLRVGRSAQPEPLK
jgi:hypothetical protein